MTNEERRSRVDFLLSECMRMDHSERVDDGRCACEVFLHEAMYWNDDTIAEVVELV